MRDVRDGLRAERNAVDDVFPGPKLTPDDPKKRARMNQWIGNLNWYFYPEMIYHVSHERNVYPELGISANDLIVQRAMPKVIRALETRGTGDDAAVALLIRATLPEGAAR